VTVLHSHRLARLVTILHSHRLAHLMVDMTDLRHYFWRTCCFLGVCVCLQEFKLSPPTPPQIFSHNTCYLSFAFIMLNVLHPLFSPFFGKYSSPPTTCHMLLIVIVYRLLLFVAYSSSLLLVAYYYYLSSPPSSKVLDATFPPFCCYYSSSLAFIACYCLSFALIFKLKLVFSPSPFLGV
jgi:hypothetical protein